MKSSLFILFLVSTLLVISPPSFAGKDVKTINMPKDQPGYQALENAKNTNYTPGCCKQPSCRPGRGSCRNVMKQDKGNKWINMCEGDPCR